MSEKKITKENKKRRRIFWRKLTAGIVTVMAAASFTAGCGLSGVSGIGGSYVFRVGSEKCSPGDVKVILLNYQKEYGELYGIDMWAHDYGDGQSLESYVKDLALAQLAQVYTLDVIAKEQEVELGEEEQKKASQAAEEYYNGLAEEEISYLGMGQEDIQKLYERYVLAQELYQTLTESVEQEVSDDEARVARVKQIYLTDESRAQEIYEQLQNGGDFDTLAVSESEAEAVDICVNRTMFSEEVTEQIFALQDGTISNVIHSGEGYYIFYCISSFDADLTEAHKADVLEQRMEDAVNGTYDAYAEKLDSSVNEDVWNEISVDTSLKPESGSFMEIYQKYFEM